MRLTLKISSIFSVVAVLVMMSCIEIDDQNIFTQEFESETRFVNLSRIGTASVTLVDTIQDVSWSFGSIDIGEASDYQVINAGSRKLIVDFPDGAADTTMLMVFATDRKGTVFILGDTSGIKYVNADERYTFNVECCQDSFLVRIFNGFLDAEEISVTLWGKTEKWNLAKDLSYSEKSSYSKFPPDTYPVTVDTGSVTIFSDTLAFTANKRYTVAVYDIVKVFVDD